jgi:hypothetical protein
MRSILRASVISAFLIFGSFGCEKTILPPEDPPILQTKNTPNIVNNKEQFAFSVDADSLTAIYEFDLSHSSDTSQIVVALPDYRIGSVTVSCVGTYGELIFSDTLSFSVHGLVHKMKWSTPSHLTVRIQGLTGMLYVVAHAQYQQTDMSVDDTSVISDLLNGSIFNPLGTYSYDCFLLDDSVGLSPTEYDGIVFYSHHLQDIVGLDVLADFASRNRSRVPLARSMATVLPCVFVSDISFAKWDSLEALYRFSKWYSFSRVGFNAQRDRALIFLSAVLAPGDGYEIFYVLKRRGIRWDIVHGYQPFLH